MRLASFLVASAVAISACESGSLEGETSPVESAVTTSVTITSTTTTEFVRVTVPLDALPEIEQTYEGAYFAAVNRMPIIPESGPGILVSLPDVPGFEIFEAWFVLDGVAYPAEIDRRDGWLRSKRESNPFLGVLPGPGDTYVIDIVFTTKLEGEVGTVGNLLENAVFEVDR